MLDYCVVELKRYPAYGSDIARAMEVVAALEQPKEPDGPYWLAKMVRRDGDERPYWGVVRWHVELRRIGGGDRHKEYVGSASESLPMAICVAALRAVGVSDAEIEEAT